MRLFPQVAVELHSCPLTRLRYLRQIELNKVNLAVRVALGKSIVKHADSGIAAVGWKPENVKRGISNPFAKDVTVGQGVGLCRRRVVALAADSQVAAAGDKLAAVAQEINGVHVAARQLRWPVSRAKLQHADASRQGPMP